MCQLKTYGGWSSYRSGALEITPSDLPTLMEHLRSPPVLVWFVLLSLSFLCCVLCTFDCQFVFFFLAMTLSVYFWLMSLNDPLVSFASFLQQIGIKNKEAQKNPLMIGWNMETGKDFKDSYMNRIGKSLL